MYQIKRQSGSSFYNETKKLRTICNEEKNKITCIEHLSNELFYEIFEYIDGCDIYKTFSNLNSRFQQLITCLPLLLKIKFRPETKSELKYCCQSIIIPNKHRILSFYLENNSFINDFVAQCIIDSTFDRLESIVLSNVSIGKSVVLLFYLKSLPRLFSLTMHMDVIWGCDLNDIYRMIFSLPSLKYNKLSLFSFLGDEDMDVFVPLAINEQFSTIEYLIIDHRCTFNELLSMLRHTPRLRHLTCGNLVESDTNIDIGKAVTLSNLTYICITNPLPSFDDFKRFIMKLTAQVQILRISQIDDKTYLDGNQRERLIIKHMPHLRSFDFEYEEYFQVAFEYTSFDAIINQFTSPFWVERQWFFEFVIDNKHTNYSIHPYRKIWLDIYKHAEIATYFNRNIDYNFTQRVIMPNRHDIDNSSIQFVPIIQLSINKISSDERNQSFIDKFKSTFVAVQFTHLNINCKDIPIGMLVRIIHLLPNLDSLKISSLPLMQSGWLFDNDGEIRFLTSISNKITKVNFEKMIDIEQVHFLLYLCLCIQYFQVDIPENMDLEMLVRFILIKASTYIPHLCSLCLNISNANEEIVYELQKLIESEKLLTNYMIKRICNNILLKWNWH